MKLKVLSLVGFLGLSIMIGTNAKGKDVEVIKEEPVIVVDEVTEVETEELILVIEDKREDVEKHPILLDAVPLTVEEQVFIQSLADDFGIDYRFAYALMWTESKFEWVTGDSNLEHPAIGYFQISTINEERMADEYGLDIYDPMQNIEAGMRIIQELMDKFEDGYNGYDTETCVVMCYKCGISRGIELMSEGYILDVVHLLLDMKSEFEL